MQQPRQRLVLKVGSQVLCDPAGGLDPATIADLAGQIVDLHGRGWDVLLVSSGAVAAGKHLTGAGLERIGDPVVRRQVLAAAGQARLMEIWQSAFRAAGFQVAQVLATRSDFQTRRHYLNMRACLEGIFAAGLVPIANENDVVSVTELMFTDNDELAGLLAGMLDADHLCLLSSVPGVLDAEGGVIAEWNDQLHAGAELLRAGTSRLGRGGMHSKLAVARKLAGLGTSVSIAGGTEPEVLKKIAIGRPAGTLFPARRDSSPARRWLASMDGNARGAVIVNPGAATALRDRSRLASLLPVGVVAVEGEFQDGDVIQIRAEDGQVLGCGRTRYGHAEAAAAMGQRDQKPIIHYDYLYLFD